MHNKFFCLDECACDLRERASAPRTISSSLPLILYSLTNIISISDKLDSEKLNNDELGKVTRNTYARFHTNKMLGFERVIPTVDMDPCDSWPLLLGLFTQAFYLGLPKLYSPLLLLAIIWGKHRTAAGRIASTFADATQNRSS